MRGILLAFFLSALPCAFARAGEVDLGAGLAQPGLNQSQQPWAVGPQLRLGYLHPLSSRWYFAASGSYTNFFNDTLSTSTIKFSFPHEHADQHWKLFALDLGAQLALGSGGGLVPYVRGTMGASFWSVKDLNGNPVKATTKDGATTDFSAQEVVFRGGLGVRYQISGPMNISLEVEGTYFSGWGADFSDATNNSRSRGIAALYLSAGYDFSFHSGAVKILSEAPPPAPVEVAASPKDADGDGITDLVDRCPGTPREAAGWVDVEGCPLDSDHDGVPDYRDRCPQSNSGGPVDSSGCLQDADFDGVSDAADSCSNTPKGVKVDSTGCPDVPAIKDTLVLRFQYPSGGAQLDYRAQAQLRELVPSMIYHPKVKLQIAGYTDDVGAVESNLALSQKRAQVVRDFLIGEGVPATQLVAMGRGEAHAVASNDTKEGRAKNRRIEILPLKK